jgi:uncharacterized protein involved in outer membrane biogenesis
MRFLFRWAIFLFTILVVVVVAGILLLNTIVKQVMESRLRANTGMDARIGSVDVGLLTPTITIEKFRLYNTPDFGGSLFIDMPELHLEYDPTAFRSGALHFKLVRLNLAEMALIQDKKGRVNVQVMGKKTQAASGKAKASSGKFNFTGIDTLNLTLGKLRTYNLATDRGQEIDFNITNQISRNIKSTADLAGLNFLLMARSGAFSSPTNSPLDLSALLKNLAAP